eukprot:TRINITY_DN22020_c0_g1_i1.p1 TRINITY_DN22020_c0_g1~~TRINITY_DN22020_c0_g1_i1.p1  ORF type:complete len:204 (+),score=49.15 TRINITY_DN22020_c0_g1_i1:564-1175(+)
MTESDTAESTAFSEEYRSLVTKKAQNLLKKAFKIAVTCNVDILLVLIVDGDVLHYSTPLLDPLIKDEDCRKMLATCIAKPPPEILAKANIVEEIKEFEESPLSDEEDIDNVEIITDLTKRNEAFKTQFIELQQKCKAISVMTRGKKGVEVMLILVTNSKKVITFSTPKMELFTKSGFGQKMIRTILTTQTKKREREILLANET